MRGKNEVHYVVHLHFLSPVHVGEFGIGEEPVSRILHSDTWYSALTVAIRQLYGPAQVKAWVDELAWESDGSEEEAPSPPLRITTAFPMRLHGVDRAGAGIQYYFPKPLLPPPGFEADPELRQEWAKEVKKTPYVSLPLFRKWVSGEEFSAADYQEIRRIRTEELRQAVSVHLIPRVALDRATSGSEYFRQGQWVLGEGMGLFLLAEIAEAWAPVIEAALRWLGDCGIGGKRSIGYGRFAVEMHPLEETQNGGFRELRSLISPQFEPEGYLLLSLYHPAAWERTRRWDGASVQWVDRRGWSTYGDGVQAKRKSVRMLGEGSVLPWKPRGHVVDVTPAVWQGNRTIFRSGIAFSIPVRRASREGGAR